MSIISNTCLIFQKQKYEKLYEEKEYQIYGEIVSSKLEKEYKNMYKLKVNKANGLIKYDNTYVYINTDKKIDLKYGDYVHVSGTFEKGQKQRNYEGFDYDQYLRTQKIHGIVETKKINILYTKESFFSIANNISKNIENRIDLIIQNKDISAICKGLIIGKTEDLSKDLQESFRISNISHVLAVSGMHVSYIVIGINLFFKRFLGRNKTNILVIIFLIIYMFITGFTPSIVRAGILGIMVSFSQLIYRKNDIWNTMAISLLFTLIDNPYSILNIGLQLSYLGTVGIILFNKNINNFLNNIRLFKRNIKIKTNQKLTNFIININEILSVTISAQIMIIPVILYHFNILGIYFFITNLLTSLIIGPIMLLSILVLIISFINLEFSKFISNILIILISILIQISKMSNLPFSKIYFATPNIVIVFIYYPIICFLQSIYILYNSKKLNNTQIRMRNIIALLKYRLRILIKKYWTNNIKIKIISIVILIVILSQYFYIIPIPHLFKNPKIYFVDVGQGDCTFIETPNKKTILIDGGGSMSKTFDVGKSTLVPYILDRGHTSIDYIFITHFDQDHCGGILTLLEELKVKNIIIGKQFQISENYNKFIKTVKEKKINLITVESGQKITIEKNIYFDILWPNTEHEITENTLNNNALVCKFQYKDFGILFTGDIEEIAEREILKLYKNDTNKLKATVLKVAHHGSKTSTIQPFLNAVNPKIALIGVGKDNNFGHPSQEVIKRLKEKSIKIYRTDEQGEITLKNV